jgi:diguanylate cyclase (GGDEF)-like protein
MRNCSPLTGLPGNISIKEYCEFLLNSHQSFSLVYMDLDYFKPFNDHYGYERGDKVLREFSQIMKDCKGDNKIFIGHIGGDDFVAVIEDEDEAEIFGRKVYATFVDRVKRFYDEEHRVAGYIESRSRKGETSHFPLMKVSIGITSTNKHPGSTYHELTWFATECKSVAKKSSDVKIFIDQRIN